MTLSLGIDIGTSACRACVIDSEGRILAETRVSLPPLERNGPAVEQDPECWWQALTDNLDQLQDQVPMGSIDAIAIDGYHSARP